MSNIIEYLYNFKSNLTNYDLIKPMLTHINEQFLRKKIQKFAITHGS